MVLVSWLVMIREKIVSVIQERAETSLGHVSLLYSGYGG